MFEYLMPGSLLIEQSSQSHILDDSSRMYQNQFFIRYFSFGSGSFYLNFSCPKIYAYMIQKPISRHDPVIFVHGNQESALNFSATATGWNNQIEYFLVGVILCDFCIRLLYEWLDWRMRLGLARVHDVFITTTARLRQLIALPLVKKKLTAQRLLDGPAALCHVLSLLCWVCKKTSYK